MSGFFINARNLDAILAAQFAQALADLVTAYAASNGSDDIGFLQAGTGGVARTAQAKQRERVTPLDFGAVGDGVADDTAEVQLALNSGAKFVDGLGLEYLVTSVRPASNQAAFNFKLKAKAQASTVSMLPVVTMGGGVNTVSNVFLWNVKINGNRQNLADISYAFGEDGGMHGFRVSSGAEDIYLVDCSAEYCGSAGLAIHGDVVSAVAATYLIKRVHVSNFKSNWNREHGWFADAVDTLVMTNIECNDNGVTLAGGGVGLPNDGRTAFYRGGAPFGAAFDIETYVGYPSSYCKNIFIEGQRGQRNATYSGIYAPNVVTDVTESPVKTVHLNGLHLDPGTSDPTGPALRMVADSHVSTKYGIHGVTVSGTLESHLVANNVRDLAYSSGFITSAQTYKAQVNNGLNCSVTVPSNKAYTLIETFSTMTPTTVAGAGTLTLAAQPTLFDSRGSLKMSLSVTIPGATIAGGDMVFTLNMPTGVTVLDAKINLYGPATNKPVACSINIASSTQVRIHATPTDNSISGEIVLDIAY